jgi:hypothetical protein
MVRGEMKYGESVRGEKSIQGNVPNPFISYPRTTKDIIGKRERERERQTERQRQR